MTYCFRHFRALMRKNFILWWRTPGCSLFEILAPILLMAVLWVIRVQVPTTSVDKDGQFSKKFMTYTGLYWNGSDWIYQQIPLENILRPFTGWAGMIDHKHSNPYDYDPGQDIYGP